MNAVSLVGRHNQSHDLGEGVTQALRSRVELDQVSEIGSSLWAESDVANVDAGCLLKRSAALPSRMRCSRNLSRNGSVRPQCSHEIVATRTIVTLLTTPCP